VPERSTENALAGTPPAGRAPGWWRPVLLVALVLALAVAAALLGLGGRLAELQEWIRSLGPAAPVAFVLMRAGAAVALVPGSAFSAAGGLLFGPVVAVVCVSIGKTLGACAAFLIARYFARDAVARWLARKERYRRLDELVAAHGTVVVALARLFPVIPFNVQNYAFGLTNIPFATYALWSWLCMLPGAAIVVVGVGVIAETLASGQVPWLMLAVLLATVALMLALAFGCAALLLPPGRRNPLDRFLAWVARRLLGLRYRIEIDGLAEVAARGTKGILFLPNHPALIDPITLVATLFPRFAPRAWADVDQVDRFLIRTLSRRFGIRAVPGVTRHGRASEELIRQAVEDTVQDLHEGRCALVYPSGHLYRQRLEDLRGNTAVHAVLSAVPDARIVLVRTRGLWGSRFSWAYGRPPNVATTLRRGAVALLLSGIFFAPKRRVTIEFYEPEHLPTEGGPEALNSVLEEFYNEGAPANTYVPSTVWESGGARQVPEPVLGADAADASHVPEGTRRIVLDHLADLTGLREIGDSDHLARDLGLDSLARAELIAWADAEFGLPAGDPDSLQTVADLMLAACGEAVSAEAAPLKPIARRWFAPRRPGGRVEPPQGQTILEAFLHAARRGPGQAAVADQISGVKTYRDLVTAVLALKPQIERLEGARIGIMLPASAGACIFYLAVLFAGKTPVMVNWTTGVRNVAHSLDLVGVRHVLTSSALLARLAARGIDLSELGERFVRAEDMGRRMGLIQKLRAAAAARVSWAALRRVQAPEPAVILFTSGSEAVPKAVPLSHANLLANMRDVCAHAALLRSDRMLGMLPPFHSFGLTVTGLLPLCVGMPAIYHADPTEAGMLARLIEAYGVTLLVGTPSFLHGIVRVADPGKLSPLRMAITGAEKCPDRVYEALARQCPQMTVLEGYGVTECSPIISVNDEAEPVPGSIGKVLPSLEHALVDVDTGRRVPAGRPGVLLVRGPSVFGGYLHYDGPSPFTTFEGKEWYRTGDLVSEDDRGVLTFRGRLKRFAKVGGEMVSLPAIEAVLDQRYGSDEGPVLAVEATPGEDHPEIVLFATFDADRAEVNRHIRQAGLSGLHSIRRVIRMDEIPLLGTGKTDYRALRERLASPDT